MWEESRRRLIPGAVVGSLIEWYDIAIYAQAAALVFGDLFFPDFSSTAGRVASFATFGVGYFARPIGAAIFGHVGDKYGRRVSLVATLVLMGCATVLIGLLPTYGAIGIAAPILLVVCRLLQGTGVGAEYVGAVTMVAEFAPPKRRGFAASLPACGVFLGMGLAAAVSALVNLLPQHELETWGWRVPFLLSAIVVGVGLYVRMRVPESPVFTKLERAQAHSRVPAATLVRAMPKRLLLVMLANGPLAFNIYAVQTFSIGYLKDRDVSGTVALVAVLVGCGVGAVSIPLIGRLSDRVGRRPAYLGAAAFCGLTAFPFFALLNTGVPALIYLAFAFTLGIGCLGIFGAQAAHYAELFETRFRFSGMALGREIPGAVLAGPAPVIAVGLTSLLDGSPWLVATAMVLVAALAFGAVLLLPETRGVPLTSLVEEPAGLDLPHSRTDDRMVLRPSVSPTGPASPR